MWIRDGAEFATLHIVGSQNNNQPDVPGAVEEFVARDKANEAWLENAFAKARNMDAPGLAIFIPGFTRFFKQLCELMIAFSKPVMVCPWRLPLFPCRQATYARRYGSPIVSKT